MVAGHLQEKNGNYYMVVNYHDAAGKRKTKWFPTGLPVKGNKKKAEKMLMELRKEFVPDEKPLEQGILFSDFMLQWLEIVKPTIAVTTYSSYSNMVKGVIAPYFKVNAESCRVTVDLHEQSPDIARGVRRVSKNEELDDGAGDQGMMFGFACKQTDFYMPLPIELAHALTKRLELVRRNGELPFLLPDGKSQVTVEYENDVPKRIGAVVLSAQHDKDISTNELRDSILSHVILP